MVNGIVIGNRIEALLEVEKKIEIDRVYTLKDSFIDKKYRFRNKTCYYNKKNINSVLKDIYNSRAKIIISIGLNYSIPERLINPNKKCSSININYSNYNYKNNNTTDNSVNNSTTNNSANNSTTSTQQNNNNDKKKWKSENTTNEWKEKNLIETQGRLKGWQLESFRESYKNKVESGISLFKKELIK